MEYESGNGWVGMDLVGNDSATHFEVLKGKKDGERLRNLSDVILTLGSTGIQSGNERVGGKS